MLILRKSHFSSGQMAFDTNAIFSIMEGKKRNKKRGEGKMKKIVVKLLTATTVAAAALTFASCKSDTRDKFGFIFLELKMKHFLSS